MWDNMDNVNCEGGDVECEREEDACEPWIKICPGNEQDSGCEEQKEKCKWGRVFVVKRGDEMVINGIMMGVRAVGNIGRPIRGLALLQPTKLRTKSGDTLEAHRTIGRSPGWGFRMNVCRRVRTPSPGSGIRSIPWQWRLLCRRRRSPRPRFNHYKLPRCVILDVVVLADQRRELERMNRLHLSLQHPVAVGHRDRPGGMHVQDVGSGEE